MYQEPEAATELLPCKTQEGIGGCPLGESHGGRQIKSSRKGLPDRYNGKLEYRSIRQIRI